MQRSTGGTTDLVDPLAGYYSFSLFPFSFNRYPLADPNPNFDTHSHLKAMELRSPHKLLMEAKTIPDDSMETDKTSAMVTENKTDRVSLSDKDPQERRPGLGLERAKFSMKPRPSQPDVVSEPTLDIANLKDPVEFFAAFERIENAKKEMQRLKGQQVPVFNYDPNLPPLSPRPRRPSLYGKSATYKHRSYASKMVDDNVEASQPSQKTSEKHIASPTSQYAIPETDVVINSRHTKVSGSTPAMTSEQNEFDELMSLDYGGLDEAELLDIVQEKLQIKLKDVDKPALPDLLHVPRREPETCDALSKMADDIARLKNIRKTAGSGNLSVSSQHRKSSVYSQVAPVQSKSPLASISLLNRHISKLSPLKDPFSVLDIDLPPARIPSSKIVHGAHKIDTRKDLYESGTPLMHVEENSAAASNPTVLEKNITAQSSEPKKQSYVVIPSDHDGGGKDLHEHGTSAAHGEETTSLPSVFSPSLEPNNISTTSEQKKSSDAVTRSGQVAEKIVVCDFSKSPAPREQSVANAGEASLDFESRGVDPSSENMEQEDEVSAENNYVHVELDNEGCSTEKSNVHGVGESTVSKDTDDIDMEAPNKEAAEPSKRKLENRRKSKVAVEKVGEKDAQANVPLLEKTTNIKRKAQEAPRASKRERASRRNSLFAAGTITENGRRRSTRIKMRPLEHWRGERFLYGRIHDSLVTVIGVKYASPSKDGDQIKVKSFVSDEYKDLVDLVALH